MVAGSSTMSRIRRRLPACTTSIGPPPSESTVMRAMRLPKRRAQTPFKHEQIGGEQEQDQVVEIVRADRMSRRVERYADLAPVLLVRAARHPLAHDERPVVCEAG